MDVLQNNTVAPGTYVTTNNANIVVVPGPEIPQEIKVRFEDVQMREFQGASYSGSCALYYQIVNPNRFVAMAQKHAHVDTKGQHNKVGMDDIERVLEEQVTQVIHSLCIRSTSGQFQKLSPTANLIWHGPINQS